MATETRDGTVVGEEPTVLGAAATTPLERRRRRSSRRADIPGRAAPPTPATTAAHDDDVVEQVYEPHAASLPPLRQYLAALWERRAFMVELAKADIRGKRSSTVLGGLWAVLEPLFQAGIYYLLFTIIREGGRPIDFLHVLIGCLFLFQLVMTALNDGGGSVRRSKRLMLNSAFPRALLPLSAIYKGILQFAPAVGVYAVFHVVLDAPVGWGLLLLPLVFVLQLVLMVGLALLASTLVVFVRDTQNLIQYLSRLLLFTSPVIYPLALLPPDVRAVLAWQPLFPLFAAYQQILTGEVPDLALLAQLAAWAIVTLLVGGRLFLRHERAFSLHL